MNHEMKAESGKYEIEPGISSSATITRGAESWQFFAFVFGAALALFFPVIDALVAAIRNPQAVAYGLIGKIAVFAIAAYLSLINKRMHNKLVRLYEMLKREKYVELPAKTGHLD